MMSMQDIPAGERRLLSRINASMRLNYQIITRDEALKDPYDPGFVLPRYFLLLAELDQLDAVSSELSFGLRSTQPQIMQMLDLINQKLNLITGALYDAMVESMLPTPTRVNISESGLSFYARERIMPGQHVHLTLSHPSNTFHLAATARVVYSEDEDLEGFRTGAYFISLHPSDRTKLAESINQKRNDELSLGSLNLPSNIE
jgi:hypothetical protein